MSFFKVTGIKIKSNYILPKGGLKCICFFIGCRTKKKSKNYDKKKFQQEISATAICGHNSCHGKQIASKIV
jgi:hypothetical protein